MLRIILALVLCFGSAMAEETGSADLNGDGVVDFKDFLIFTKQYGSKSGDKTFVSDIRASEILPVLLSLQNEIAFTSGLQRKVDAIWECVQQYISFATVRFTIERVYSQIGESQRLNLRIEPAFIDKKLREATYTESINRSFQMTAIRFITKEGSGFSRSFTPVVDYFSVGNTVNEFGDNTPLISLRVKSYPNTTYTEGSKGEISLMWVNLLDETVVFPPPNAD